MNQLLAWPYQLRLLGLCLAVFFLVHVALGLAVSALSGAAVRRADGMAPSAAVRFLLFVRLAPMLLGLFAVAALCLPSYLSLEPDASPERVSGMFMLAAVLGLALWAIGAARATRALLATLRYRQYCERYGEDAHLPGEAAPLLVLDRRERSPLLFLAGVFHPRLVASRTLLGALSPEQLEVSLRHERAHAESHDNVKRLLLMLAPGLLPGCSGFAPLERAWSRLVEWAADDRAVGGDSRRSLSLAGALVKVARIGSLPRRRPLIANLLVEKSDLASRVNRLLAPPALQTTKRRLDLWLPGVLMGSMAIMVAVLLRPGALYAVHRVLETLTH